MKTVKTEYAPITVETLEITAIKAAFIALRTANAGKAKAVKKDGETVAHDGTLSGCSKKTMEIKSGVAWTLANAFQKMLACKAAYEQNPSKATLKTYEESIKAYTAGTANDMDDCISVAKVTLWENIARNDGITATETAFVDAMNAVHGHIFGEKNNTGVRIRAKYNDKGELLDAKEYRYIMFPHLYYDSFTTDENGDMSFDIVDANDELSKAIKGMTDNATLTECLATMNATQKRIIQYVARGMTYETIAKRIYGSDCDLKKGVQNIKKNVQRIREKCAGIEH